MADNGQGNGDGDGTDGGGETKMKGHENVKQLDYGTSRFSLLFLPPALPLLVLLMVPLVEALFAVVVFVNKII